MVDGVGVERMTLCQELPCTEPAMPEALDRARASGTEPTDVLRGRAPTNEANAPVSAGGGTGGEG